MMMMVMMMMMRMKMGKRVMMEMIVGRRSLEGTLRVNCRVKQDDHQTILSSGD